MRRGSLRLDGVWHAYGNATPVLADVSVAIEPGEVLVVHGRNGAGKTTLLRIAAGVLRPRAGTAKHNGRVGYLPQRSDDPPPRLSAAAWLSTVARTSGATATRDRLDLLRMLGVESAAAPLDTLSVGTLAKVMLAGAFGGAPDVVVLDEPFASLDSSAMKTTLELIGAAATDGAAVLISDHDGAAATVATRIATITDRRLDVQRAASRPARVRIVAADGKGSPIDVIVDAAARDPLLMQLLSNGGSIFRVEEVR